VIGGKDPGSDAALAGIVPETAVSCGMGLFSRGHDSSENNINHTNLYRDEQDDIHDADFIPCIPFIPVNAPLPSA